MKSILCISSILLFEVVCGMAQPEASTQMIQEKQRLYSGVGGFDVWRGDAIRLSQEKTKKSEEEYDAWYKVTFCTRIIDDGENAEREKTILETFNLMKQIVNHFDKKTRIQQRIQKDIFPIIKVGA